MLKGKLTKGDIEYLSKSKSVKTFKKRLLKVRRKFKVTNRKCIFCKREFQRIDDGLLDYTIGKKNICSVCAVEKGFLREYINENDTLLSTCWYNECVR